MGFLREDKIDEKVTCASPWSSDDGSEELLGN